MMKILGAQLKFHDLTDPASHAEAISDLRRAPTAFVVIFAHGGTDYLRGGEYRSKANGEMVEIEKFIARDNLNVFKDKVVFCMSCGSNGLAQASIEAGAISFVGFDEIPFNSFDAAGEPIGSHVLVKHSQELIAQAIQSALERFLAGRASLDESIDYLKLWIAKKAVAYVRQMEPKGVKERKDVAALLLKVRSGLRFHGQRGVHFVTNG